MDDLHLETQTQDILGNRNPQSVAMPKIAKQIFEPTPGNDFRGKETPEWARKLYLEPLKEGWRREVVTRATPSHKGNIDVYYWSPEGRKFRSRPEIAEFLSVNGISKFSSVFNFTFARCAFGDEFTPYEIKRHAGSVWRGRPFAKGTDVEHAYARASCPTKTKRKRKKLSGKKQGGTKMADFTKDLPVMLTGDDFSPDKLDYSSDFEEEQPSTHRGKKQKLSDSDSEREDREGTPESQLYCVCNDVESGQMILCDNSECEIGWYHFECVRLLVEPEGPWYCPFCRGPTHGVINPSFVNNADS